MIDAIDRKILHHVQRDNLLTSARLSELVGLSQTSVQRRLARLRATKAIEADIAVVSPEAVGRPLTMLIAVELARERSDIIDRFKRAVRERSIARAGARRYSPRPAHPAPMRPLPNDGETRQPRRRSARAPTANGWAVRTYGWAAQRRCRSMPAHCC